MTGLLTKPARGRPAKHRSKPSIAWKIINGKHAVFTGQATVTSHRHGRRESPADLIRDGRPTPQVRFSS